MTPSQRILARQALGLPNADGVSDANGVGTLVSDVGRAATLATMTRAGLARLTIARPAFQCFTLTRAGAERALEPGERLDPAHFPPLGQD